MKTAWENQKERAIERLSHITLPTRKTYIELIVVGDQLLKENTILQNDCKHLAELGQDDLRKRIESDQKLEQIRRIVLVPDCWNHDDPLGLIREVLKPSIKSQQKRIKQ